MKRRQWVREREVRRFLPPEETQLGCTCSPVDQGQASSSSSSLKRGAPGDKFLHRLPDKSPGPVISISEVFVFSPSAVGSGKGAGLQVLVLSDAGNLLSLWRLGTPSPRGSPENSPWRGGAPAVPHASFQPLQLQLQDLLNEPFPARGRSGRVAVACLERTSDAPGTRAGKAPRPPPRFHPARRGRESPRGSSHPRGFSPVAATLLRERSRLSCFPPGWSARGSCSSADAGGKGR